MKLSKQVSEIELKKHYPHNKDKVKRIYEEEIIPIQVQGVASIWYKAISEANGV
jgi:hypothetical protein